MIRLSSIRFWLRRIFPRKPGYDYSVLSERPLVVFTHHQPGLEQLVTGILQHGAAVLITSRWTVRNPPQLARAKAMAAIARQVGKGTMRYLAASPDELAFLAEHDVPAIVCNTASFVDEHIFDIQPGVTKRFDAIYDARLSAFKRHELTTLVPNTAYVTYTMPNEDDHDYIERMRELLKGRAWLNGPFSTRIGYLTPKEVAHHINESRTGLMLSAAEGQNYASLQYMLCGVPCISTPSIGGRDVFYEEPFATIVEATPEAVRDGVQRMIARNLTPEFVRAGALRVMQRQRDGLIEIVESLQERAGVKPHFRADWPRLFSNKLLAGHTQKEFAQLLRSTRASR